MGVLHFCHRRAKLFIGRPIIQSWNQQKVRSGLVGLGSYIGFIGAGAWAWGGYVHSCKSV